MGEWVGLLEVLRRIDRESQLARRCCCGWWRGTGRHIGSLHHSIIHLSSTLPSRSRLSLHGHLVSSRYGPLQVHSFPSAVLLIESLFVGCGIMTD